MTYLAEIHLLKPFEKWNLKIEVTVHALSYHNYYYGSSSFPVMPNLGCVSVKVGKVGQFHKH